MERLVYNGSLKSWLNDRANTQSPGSDTQNRVGSRLGDSQGEYTESLISLSLECGLFAHKALQMGPSCSAAINSTDTSMIDGPGSQPVIPNLIDRTENILGHGIQNFVLPSDTQYYRPGSHCESAPMMVA